MTTSFAPLNTTAAAASPALATARPAPVAPRFEMYTLIHKALRQFMADTLRRLGRADVDDAQDLVPALDQVDSLLVQLRAHLQHENDFVHTAIEARRPGAARRTRDDHVGHLDALANLEDESRALRHARADQRATLVLRLYRHLAVFVAENLEHMQVEETENQAALWALYSDAELIDIEGQILASLGPDEMALTLRWLAAALNPQELAGVMAGVRAAAPQPAFEALLDVVCCQLDEGRRAKLLRTLGLPPVPGLMSC